MGGNAESFHAPLQRHEHFAGTVRHSGMLAVWRRRPAVLRTERDGKVGELYFHRGSIFLKLSTQHFGEEPLRLSKVSVGRLIKFIALTVGCTWHPYAAWNRRLRLSYGSPFHPLILKKFDEYPFLDKHVAPTIV